MTKQHRLELPDGFYVEADGRFSHEELGSRHFTLSDAQDKLRSNRAKEKKAKAVKLDLHLIDQQGNPLVVYGFHYGTGNVMAIVSEPYGGRTREVKKQLTRYGMTAIRGLYVDCEESRRLVQEAIDLKKQLDDCKRELAAKFEVEVPTDYSVKEDPAKCEERLVAAYEEKSKNV